MTAAANLIQPDLPGFDSAPAAGRCQTCGGTATVWRPERTIVQKVVYTEECGDHATTEIEATIGGLDACPECAARAEVDYLAGGT